MAITNDLKGEAWANASNLPLVLLTIDHADLAQPIRVVNNKTDVVSNGNTFTGFPFDLPLPKIHEQAPPATRLSIDNVSREIIQAVRSISTPADVTLQVVRQDDPDTIELELPAFKLKNIRADALIVTGDMVYEDLVTEPYPAGRFTPAQFPGIP